MMKSSVFILLLGFGIAGSSCAMNKFTADRTADMLSEASAAFNEEQDLVFAKEAMPANLKMMEGLTKSSPENQTLLSMLAQGYCSYAFGFLEDSENLQEVERARQFYWRGYNYGLGALPEEVQAFSKGELDGFERALKAIDPGSVAPLFWTAYCLAGWVNLNKADISAVAELSRAEIMMRQVLEHDEDFYHGSVHLFYGAYFGSRPKMLGGNPVKAKEHLERAIKMTEGKFLLPKLFLAQFYALPLQDEVLFESTLKEVMAASVELMPSERLANQVAKKRAAKLLGAKKDLF